MNLGRLIAIAAAELTRVLRDRPSLSLLLVLPAAQILLFGFAIRIEPHDLPVGLIGSGPRIEAVRTAVAAEPRLRLVDATGWRSPLDGLRGGRAVLVVSTGDKGLRIDVDGADPVAAQAALSVLQQRLLDRTAAVLGESAEARWAFNPERRSAWVLVSGLGGVIVMISMLMLGAQSIVREREEGAWEAFLLSRAGGAEIMLGKLIPYLPLAAIQEALVLAVGLAVFKLPLQGAALALIALVAPFAAAHLAWGLALSAISRTRLQAIQGAILLYLPSILLSGFLFPFAAMPAWARTVGEALPLTHFVRASRGVLLRGEGAAAAWREAPPILLCAAIGLGVALAVWRAGRLATPPIRLARLRASAASGAGSTASAAAPAGAWPGGAGSPGARPGPPPSP